MIVVVYKPSDPAIDTLPESLSNILNIVSVLTPPLRPRANVVRRGTKYT